MEHEKLESLLIDYIDGKLPEAECRAVEQELIKNEASYKLYEQLKEVMHTIDNAPRLEPSSALKMSFDAMLEQEIKAQPKAKTIFFQPVFYRVAAAVVLLILGGGVGFWISQERQHERQLAQMRTEVEATKQLLMGMLENQQSASTRVAGATVALRDVAHADDEIVNALVNAMNEDPNTNVRIAALEALGKFHMQPHVRKALIAGLKTQKDPLVQIALIRLLVDFKEKEVKGELERISTDEETLPAVKDEAHVGLLRLS